MSGTSAQRLLIVLWSCGPDRPQGAALVAAPLVYALAARALDLEVEIHFTASTVRWLLPAVAAEAFTDAARSKTVLDYLSELQAAGVPLHPCALALHEHARGALLVEQAGEVAGAATVIAATVQANARTLVF